MRRGIIRIIAGVVLLAWELLTFTLPSSTTANVSYNIGYYIGYYSPAILGIILLISGGCACGNGIYSKLILHHNNRKLHTVIKWCGFALSTLLFLVYLLAFIASWRNANVLALLNIFGLLSFSVYALFYMYRKPSCLFSAALIFIGASYIYGICRNIIQYIVYLPEEDYFAAYVFTGILPKIAAGILYIIIASIIHKERFSVKAVRVLGWIVYALEILSRVVCNIIVLQSLYFMDVLGLLYLLFVTVLMLYLCVFKMNTLRGVSAPAAGSASEYPCFSPSTTNTAGWQCACGRIHPAYETACVCGRSKFDAAEQPKSNVTATNLPTAPKIRFCRKCGEKLIEESKFCRACGNRIAEIVVPAEETTTD